MNRQHLKKVLVLMGFSGLLGPATPAKASPAVSMTKCADGLELKTKQGQLRLQWYGDEIVRVRFVPGSDPFAYDKSKLDKTMLVETAQQPVHWKLNETNDKWVMTSSALKVEVDRSSAAVAFFDAGGRALLSERGEENRTFEAAHVGSVNTQTGRLVFNMSDADPIYGMGQVQDGFFNRRHVPTRLLQHNTRIALPVVVSPAGYGLFFNHMTYMDINGGSPDGLVNLTLSNVKKGGPQITEDDMATDGAKRAKDSTFTAVCTGTASFTPKTSGVYGFYIRNASRSDVRQTPMRIWVDGQEILHFLNFWNEAAMGASVPLEAGKTVRIEFDGTTKDSTFQVTPPDNRFDVAIEAAEDLDYFFLGGATIDTVVKGYRQLTGAAPIPPKYQFGFWQCRERYRNQNELLENAREFRERNIPVDVIVQDWQWWTKGSRFQWNDRYPDPKAMCDELESLHYRVMASVWGIGAGDDQKKWGKELFNGNHYNVYDQAGREAYWTDLRDNVFNVGIDAYWHDGTEGDPIPERADTEFGPGFLHHNDFALLVSKASYEGQLRDDSGKTRPVILTRSAWGGQQRYGSVMWSGDISSTWDHYRKQIAAGLNFCMAGVPYWTTDTAGFFRKPGQVAIEDGGADADQYTSKNFQELLTRWMQYSTFCPVQRIHGYQSNTEMWRYEPETYANLLDMVKLRYRLLPYSYSLARRVSQDGYTLMRGLPMDFGKDPKVVEVYDQFMFGPAFMACPVIEKGARSRTVYLPAGTPWIDFWSGKSFDGGQSLEVDAPLNRLPVFVKAGSLVPCGPDVEWAEQKPWDALELRIYPGADGTFTLYEDEGENHNYEKGQCSEITFTWNDAKQELTISDRTGNFQGMVQQRAFRVSVVRDAQAIGIPLEADCDQIVSYQGTKQTVRMAQDEPAEYRLNMEKGKEKNENE
jgi:alpha-D-xyloside xylohydrolase